jgi:chaperonin GroES
VTAGGVILPGSAKEKPNKGKVVSVGPGKPLDNGDRAPLTVKKGDVVFYGKYAGTEVKVSGTEFKILRESDILGIEA